MRVIKDFFVEIDRRWPSQEAHEGKVRLRLIGSGALMLQTRYQRGTKDSDVFETTELAAETKNRLLALAGPGTKLHEQQRIYLDIVANGIPFLPHVPVWHDVPEITRALQHFELAALDVVDVVVSKLKRFNPNDQSDIDEMIQLGIVPHERLLERFRSAMDVFSYEARAEDLPKYIKNLHRVERDMIGVLETEIELPSWVR